MRKLFINPEIEIKEFELENIVTASGEGGEPDPIIDPVTIRTNISELDEALSWKK